MPYVAPEVVQRVKQIDLLTYERPGAACDHGPYDQLGIPELGERCENPYLSG